MADHETMTTSGRGRDEAAEAVAARAARHRAGERRYDAADRGRSIGTNRPRTLDIGLSIDDGVILLGILLGGAAGWAAAATLRPGERLSRHRSPRPGSDGSRRMRAPHSRPQVEDEETAELIASNKVEGAVVYDRHGEKIGTVHTFMVGKRTGRVAYAVVSVGGFLGIGETHHALPWSSLAYDDSKGGYVVDADKDRLLHAPHHAVGEDALARPEHRETVREFWSPGSGSRVG